jgi:hypothetical protein
LKLLIHPRSGRIAENEDDGAAADDDGGEGCATVGPLKLVFFAFFGSLVATALILVTFGAAAEFLLASLAVARAFLASSCLFLQSKHVWRGLMVPFCIICARKLVSCTGLKESSA